MALNKIQGFIKKLSESNNVKKVVGDIQNLSTEIQNRVHHLNKDEAVKKYKEIMQKVTQVENDFEKEMNKVVGKLKKSATEVEKNLDLYKRKALTKKNKLEKMLKGEKKASSAKKAKTSVRKKAPTKKEKRKA